MIKNTVYEGGECDQSTLVIYRYENVIMHPINIKNNVYHIAGKWAIINYLHH
jgi:hypothetical protein